MSPYSFSFEYPQGVATQIYAAVSPELEGSSGAYIENCAIAQPSKTARDLEQVVRLDSCQRPGDRLALFYRRTCLRNHLLSDLCSAAVTALLLTALLLTACETCTQARRQAAWRVCRNKQQRQAPALLHTLGHLLEAICLNHFF